MYGGRGRTRTGTPVSQKQILRCLAPVDIIDEFPPMSRLCRTHPRSALAAAASSSRSSPRGNR
jgi:hypothetical protein